jgi:flavin-dependent dehydrogenase
MTRTHRRNHDVVVVGARVAGASTALLLARLGYDVAVVDRTRFPSDTLSTHCLARGGVVQLARLGLLDAVLASGAPALRRITFHFGGTSTTREVKHRAGVDLLLAPRRHLLDPLLAEAAAAAGADLRTGVSVADVLRDRGGRVAGVVGRNSAGERVELRARFVVGADGLHSRIARSVAAPVVERRHPGGAAHYAYWGGIPWHGVEFYVEDGSFAGVFPTHNGEACVWVCTPRADALAARRRAGSVDEALDRLLVRAAPQLAERLAGARRTEPARGVLSLPNQRRRSSGPGWALVGDAGQHRDAITGHGMTDALRDAELLAGALDAALSGAAEEAAALSTYQRARDAASREVFEITSALSAFPPPTEFAALQKRLSGAIEAEATGLAARPLPGERRLAVA